MTLDLSLLQDKKICLVGAGKMGAAMLESWLRCGLPGTAVTVISPSIQGITHSLCAQHSITMNPLHPVSPDILMLAIKPQMLDDVAPKINPLITNKTLVLSILAGKSIEDLKKRFITTQYFVRAMPNLPASVSAGATGAVSSFGVPGDLIQAANALLRASGTVEWLDSEEQINTVAAISGSGPAYVFLLVECLAEAGVKAGLPRDLALRLARQTIIGSGLLLKNSPLPAAALRENVTSPGGTTAAALAVFRRENGLQELIDEAVLAAIKRAEELSG